jgi:hypothetical protein
MSNRRYTSHQHHPMLVALQGHQPQPPTMGVGHQAGQLHPTQPHPTPHSTISSCPDPSTYTLSPQCDAPSRQQQALPGNVAVTGAHPPSATAGRPRAGQLCMHLSASSPPNAAAVSSRKPSKVPSPLVQALPHSPRPVQPWRPAVWTYCAVVFPHPQPSPLLSSCCSTGNNQVDDAAL